MPTDRDAPRPADALTRFGPPPTVSSGAAAAAAAGVPNETGPADTTSAMTPTHDTRSTHETPVPAVPLSPPIALRDAFGALLRSDALTADALPSAIARSAELRAAVSADVRALRASGLPAEAVVIAMKARARDALRLALAGSPPAAADLPTFLLSAGDRHHRAEEWLARAVSWCIDEYYSPGGEDPT
ncbi:MAG TPA: hypothetical protein VNS52_09375 [Gemmatimonadaceae bacterium]|nr:hypothetical protein [Gemmatimonadaceae bacterium]